MQYEILRSPGGYGGLPGGEICGNGRQTLMHEKEPGQHEELFREGSSYSKAGLPAASGGTSGRSQSLAVLTQHDNISLQHGGCCDSC